MQCNKCLLSKSFLLDWGLILPADGSVGSFASHLNLFLGITLGWRVPPFMVILLFPEHLGYNKWPMWGIKAWPPCLSCGQYQRAIPASRFSMGSANTFFGTSLQFNSSLCSILFYSLSYRYCSSGHFQYISCTLISISDSVSQGTLHKIFCHGLIKYWNTDDYHTV